MKIGVDNTFGNVVRYRGHGPLREGGRRVVFCARNPTRCSGSHAQKQSPVGNDSQHRTIGWIIYSM